MLVYQRVDDFFSKVVGSSAAVFYLQPKTQKQLSRHEFVGVEKVRFVTHFVGSHGPVAGQSCGKSNNPPPTPKKNKKTDITDADNSRN